MSPEQLIGKSTEAGDVYSLGVVLYEMLTGEPPFRSGDIAYQIREIVPDPPVGVSPKLSAIVLKCLEKKPERRFASVRALREELDGAAEARRMEEEARADAHRQAEEQHRQAEEQRKAEETRRHAAEERKQAEIEAKKKREEEERRRQEDARRAEEERKRAAEGLVSIAIALLDRGAFDEAETKLQEALRLDPAQPEARGALECCRAGRAAAEARRQSEQARKTPPAVSKPNYRIWIAAGVIVLGIIVISLWLGGSRPGSENSLPPQNPSESAPATQETPASRQTPSVVPKKTDTNLAIQAELSHWESIKNSNDPAVFRDYIGKYPSGRFVEVARSNLRNFEIARIKRQVREHLDTRNWDAAGQRITELLKISPEDPDAPVWRKQISADVESEKRSAEVARLKVQIRGLIKARDWRNALVQVQNLLKIAPDDAEALSWRTHADGEMGKESAASKRKAAISSSGIEFVSIPAGKFMMGCSPGDSQCDADENPRHEVTISRSFELGKYEVTQGQWIKVMASNPSNFKGDDRLPVEWVSWNDIQGFIAKLNAFNDGYRYRLPTEAEWEYAARAGTVGPYYGNLDAVAWHDPNSGNKTHPVGQKQPNGFGLYDMLGNVWEWCSDWYGESYYGSSPATDPKGASSGQSRILRGGSWDDVWWYARVSSRYGVVPGGRDAYIGFRVCREPL
jgi:formylglycine-generating enzyme required for sulfatase activity